MGVCLVCKRRTGFLRGKKMFYGKELCNECYGPFVKEYKNYVHNQFRIANNVPDGAYVVDYTSGYAKMAHVKQYIWIKDDVLCFFPAEPVNDDEYYFVYKIPLNKIEVIGTQGGTISGNTAMGSIVEKALSGDINAVFENMKKINTTQSGITTNNNSLTYINYFVDNGKHTLFFKYNDYYTFKKAIPWIGYPAGFDNTLSSLANSFFGSAQSFFSSTQTSNSDAIEQLKELSELRDKGIITEQEFNEKKKLLLDNIK